MTKEQERVLSLIPKGKRNAIHIRDIKDYTGYKAFDIKYIIMELREHYPICSGNDGYWLGDIVDMREMMRDFRTEIKTKQAVLHNLETVYNNMMLEEDY